MDSPTRASDPMAVDDRPKSLSRDRSHTPRSHYSRSPSMDRRPSNGRDDRSPARNDRYRSRSRGRSLSRTPSRSRTRSYSRDRSYSRSRSRSRSESPRPRSTKVSREIRGIYLGLWLTHLLLQIVVERLTKNVNEDHLYEIFGQYGDIDDLDLPVNRSSGMNRGTAYILYFTEADAQAAITHMHEAQLDGAIIHVSIVLPRRKVSPSPPLARRGPRGPPANVRPVLEGPGGRAPGGRGWRSPAGGPGRFSHLSVTPRSWRSQRQPQLWQAQEPQP
ncbi:hypothetical protein N0V88_003384 [Collariella sp. IMI 366227]|nr:hypothetical protein N0V88_003384 [Collariella sp. IMI 366227]